MSGHLSPKNQFSVRPWVFAPHIGEMYILLFACLLFWFFYSPTGESVGPIFTINTSNDVVLRKVVPFYGKINKI